MLVKINSIALMGVETVGVDVEVNVSSRGFPNFDIVGLPDKSVDESKHRVKTAFSNSGLEFPDKRITVNLAPADIVKEGSFYDLPIAVGIMCAKLGINIPEKSLFFGEISLDGGVRHTKGALLLALYAKEQSFKNIFVPTSCAREASSVTGVNVYGVNNLLELKNHLAGEGEISKYVGGESAQNLLSLPPVTFLDIAGQEQVKRALIISAAGGHNLLMVGPPGAGKTLLAKSILSLLPPLTQEEAIEVTKIYTSVGKIPPNGGLMFQRPFRSPHHTVSYAGMIGGGSSPTPGEVSLAHRGVLFMDEFGEFPREILETLRQPLEDGFVTISRSKGSLTFPSRFTLIASSNPCPCGYYGHPVVKCLCSSLKIENYQKRLSGPILDRIDLHVNVFAVDPSDLKVAEKPLLSKSPFDNAQQMVSNARNIQNERFKKHKIFANAEMDNSLVRKFCPLGKEEEKLLEMGMRKFCLSARGYFKILKISRTLADLVGEEKIESKHIAEAIQYRTRTAPG